VQKYFDILNRLRATRECDGRTDRQRNVIIENAALNYIARAIILTCILSPFPSNCAILVTFSLRVAILLS